MAYKIMVKNKISKESENLKIARDKGINSSDWLGSFVFERKGQFILVQINICDSFS